ncbi:hypothetical protein [Ferruginibacter sp.]
MQKYLLLFLFTATFLFACDQKADTAKANQFATQIHDATTGSNKAIQQAFIDKMTETLKAVKQDNAIKVDTRTLRQSLNDAIQANHKSFVALNGLTEIDNSIQLKEKAIAENRLFLSLYEHEFITIIDALESDAPGKMATLDKCISAFSSREKEIRATQRTAQEAAADFEQKYNIGNLPGEDKK